MNGFIDTSLILAFQPSALADFPRRLALYGATAQDAGHDYFTLLAHWDDTERTRIRAGHLGESVKPIQLTDGRYAVEGLWTQASVDALNRGEFPDSEFIDEATFQALLPVENL